MFLEFPRDDQMGWIAVDEQEIWVDTQVCDLGLVLSLLEGVRLCFLSLSWACGGYSQFHLLCRTVPAGLATG